MLTIRKTIKLHKAQADFRNSDAPFRGFVGGRGAGKTWVGAYDLLRRAKKGRTYLVASPTGILLNDITFPTLRTLATLLGIWGEVKLTPYPTLQLTTGASVRFRTAEDPERLRGPNLSGIWLDEASLMEQAVYDVCIASLREAGEFGWLSATFTPKGPYHWTYDVFGKGKPDTALFRSRTSQNPFNPKGFEARIAGQYTPIMARQELGGEFVEIEGAEWPADWFPESLWFRDYPADSISMRVICLDPSKGRSQHGDYSAFAMVARDRAGTLWVEADLERRPTTKICSDAILIAARFERDTGGRLDGLGCESDVFQELLADELIRVSRAVGVQLPIYKVRTENAGKEVRIRRLTPYLNSGAFRFRDTPGTRLLVRQLQEFPVGDYDDGPDALESGIRLMVNLLIEKQKARR